MSNPYIVKIGDGSATGGFFQGSYPAQAVTDIQNLGAQTLFYQIRWDLIDTSGGTSQSSSGYHWTSWDNAVSQCNQAGIDIVLAVMFPPIQLQQVIGGSASGVAQNSYLNTFCSQIAHAYTSGDAGQRGTRHIKGVYVGNEDYDHGGSGGLPAQLVSALKTVYPTIKAINSSMLVIAGAKLQRNLAFYQSWFDTLLNPSTGAYIGGVFQADVVTFHYHSALPVDTNNVPLSPDPRVTTTANGFTIPSWRLAWQTVQNKLNAYNLTVPIWADENGENCNTNPGRPPASVLTDGFPGQPDAVRWTYLNYELDEARNSGAVQKYGIFTLAEYAGYSPSGASYMIRDGQSLIQGTIASPVYGASWTGMQSYISTHSSWVAVKALTAQAHSKFLTLKAHLTTKAASRFNARTSLKSKAAGRFISSTGALIFQLTTIPRAFGGTLFINVNFGTAKQLLTWARSKFFTHYSPKIPDYSHATLTGNDGIDTLTAVDGRDTFTGIG